jgi:cytosine/adenosine deaminase-related metal-dependent hydrolase
MTRIIDCAHLIADADGPVQSARSIVIEDGRISAVNAASRPVSPLLALPALVNAHDHGRAVRTSSIGAAGKPLEAWLHYLALFPSVDPYAAAVVALSRSALGGVGTVMMHYTRAQGFTDLPTEVKEVARAAKDVGVRVGFAVSMKDRNPLVYGPSEPILAALPENARIEIEKKFLRQPPSPAEFVALADAVADAATSPMFDVQYGPNGVQWCSNALLEAVAEASQRTGRRVHMHLLETRYQRDWMDQAYPDGVVKHLDKIGFLSPRLTLAHCVWARPDELELLAARGVTIVVSNSSNLHLRSGVAPVPAMLENGCRVALGVDGKALDEDDDGLRELRLAHLLHAGTGFKVAASREQMLKIAFANGRFAVTNVDDGGAIKPGAPADLLLLDWAAIDDDGLRDDLDPIELLLGRATLQHVRELIVAGRTIVKDGTILGADLPAARAQVLDTMRSGMKAGAPLAAAMPALDRVMARHFEPHAHCC